MMEVLWVAIAGAMGAVSRFAVSSWTRMLWGETFPYGTLAVNVVGCLLLGLVMTSSLLDDLLPLHLRMALTIGFLGAFTTFSTFGYETMRYVESGDWTTAGLNVSANVILGLVATFGGIWLGRQFFGTL